MKDAGAAMAFRDALESVLLQSVKPYNCSPPASRDPRTLHRDAILDICLDASLPKDRIRRATLEQDMNGNLQSPVIDWHVQSADPDLKAWSKRMASNLFPCAFQIF
jgi:hypothetical protein